MTYWLHTITDTELRKAIRSLLLEMEMLATAPALNLEPSVSHSKSEGSVPRGAFGRREDLSMHEEFTHRFKQAAPDLDDLRAVLIRGQREYEYHTKGIPVDRITVQARRDEAKDVEMLLQYGEGKAAGVIAAMYSWHIGWVEQMRERNGRDRAYGHERPKWRQTPEDERYALCERLCDEGLTQTEAAERLGIAQSTVCGYWPKTRLRSVA